MILTIVYLAICLFSASTSVDYSILTATVILDIVAMGIGGYLQWKK
jgi:hypothetical protein